ncbi:DUF4352 domain-containing protein [Methanomassiliicoccus luminyensis]|uniref:DUF4352 domain-containing protein n=1 Tax=Methanomassiliicoccus luminyensis TaxID=1080712 RepID=UPI00037EDF7E|nr:DUF4352 domain-containing protein [Methanomassiliicoccus luminyensis]
MITEKQVMIISALTIVAILGSIVAVVSLDRQARGPLEAGYDGSGAVKVSISSVRPMASPSASEGGIVQVRLNITNGDADPLYLTPYFFRLTGSDGVAYNYHWSSGASMPDSLGSGATGEVVIAYQLPAGVTPELLTFYDVTHSVPVPL